MCHKLIIAVTLAVCAAQWLFVAEHQQGRHCHRCDTKMLIKNVESALVHFQTENDDACPASLKALVDQHILSSVPVDGWGQPLVFVCPGWHNPDGADIVSAGRDRIFGTSDDIRSWEL